MFPAKNIEKCENYSIKFNRGYSTLSDKKKKKNY